MKALNRITRSVVISVFLLAAIDLSAAEQPELVEQKPEYTRTKELPDLNITFADMQSILEKAANLLSDANVNAPRKTEWSFRESLTLGKESDQIQIAGHSFPANARLPKAAYPLSYFYSWTNAPVSKLHLELGGSWSHLTISGTAVDQVEAISAALEHDLLQHVAAPAPQQPKIVEQKPEYTRTRDLPALKISFTDMQSVLDSAARLLSDANRDEGKKPKDIFFTQTLDLGTGPDAIKVVGHAFPENARIPDTAYALSYYYSWPEAPVSSLQLDLRDYGNKLSVAGSVVEQVDAISAALERDLSKHSAIGGGLVRTLGGFIIGTGLAWGVILGGIFCITQRQWRFLGVPICSALGLALLCVLPFREIFAGFAAYKGDPSFIVRYEPQIAFGGLIVTLLLSFLIPIWQESRQTRAAQKK